MVCLLPKFIDIYCAVDFLRSHLYGTRHIKNHRRLQPKYAHGHKDWYANQKQMHYFFYFSTNISLVSCTMMPGNSNMLPETELFECNIRRHNA